MISYLLVLAFLPTAWGGPSDAMNEGDAALAAPRELLRAGKLKEAEEALLETLKGSAEPPIKASACVYLGYIRDRQDDRPAALGYFQQAEAFGDKSGLAKAGLERPLRWIRHLDRGRPEKPPPPVPAQVLTPEQMAQNLDFACRKIPEYYQALKEKQIPWDSICERYGKALQSVSTTPEFYRLMFRLAAELKDSHTHFSNFPYSYLSYGAGASCRCDPSGRRAWIAAVEDGSSAQLLGLKRGDEIASVDGRSVEEQARMISSDLRGDSTERLRIQSSCRNLLQANDESPLGLTLGGDSKVLRILRKRRSPPEIPPPPGPSGAASGRFLLYSRLPNGLGYIRFKDFQDTTGAALRKYRRALAKLQGMRGLLIDVRGNPGGFSDVPRGIIRTLIKEKITSTVSTVRRPNERLETLTETLEPDPKVRVGVPAAVLIDETSQSAAELFASMAAYAGIPLIGSPTGGMLGGWSYDLDFPCGLRLAIQYGYPLLPDGSPVEGRGVPPDVPAGASIEDELAGRDPALDAAVEFLSKPGRPQDFDRFWDGVRKELSAIPLDAELTAEPRASGSLVECGKADYRSIDRVMVHAWYCRPKGPGPYPAVLISPWYGLGRIDPPRSLATAGVAALWYQGRGYEVDRSSYPLDNSWYILSGIQKKETYVYRQMVSHALRALDFLAQRPEVDKKRIGVMGSSQGGGLSLLVAGLDKRVTAAAADFPFLSDWKESLPIAKPPFGDVRDYITQHPEERDAVLKTVSYFDALDVADRIKIPVLVQVGLKDRTCPAVGVRAVYDRIAGRKKTLKEYPDADHGDRNAERWQAMVDYLIGALR